MKPFVKWPGGKKDEYKLISQYFPDRIDKYVEPFIGGGAIYLAISDCKKYYINDKSDELIYMYEYIKTSDKEFFRKLEEIFYNWRLVEKIIDNHQIELTKKYLEFSQDKISDIDWANFILNFVLKNRDEFNGILESWFNIDIKHFIDEVSRTVIQKTNRMKKIEKQNGKLKNEDIVKNLETALKSAYYTHFRYLYNNYDKYNISNEFRIALFYFIREYCYSSMFRYNKSGKFNVPYGGISYNRKDIESKIVTMKNQELISRLDKTMICSLDFEEFLNRIDLQNNDFIFLDPPYDSEFSTYSNNKFDRLDQKRLVDFLKTTKAKFMIVIKNTEYIWSLYQNNNFFIKPFDKKYLVSFQNRNDKDVEHLIITNYKI